MIPIINKPTRATNHNATIIDHILTNSFDSKIDTGIFKVDIQDPVFVTKRDINPSSISLFKEKLLKVDWILLNPIKNPNEAYKTFLNVFINPYEIVFSKIKIKVNSKTRLSPWITRGFFEIFQT